MTQTFHPIYRVQKVNIVKFTFISVKAEVLVNLQVCAREIILIILVFDFSSTGSMEASLSIFTRSTLEIISSDHRT